jgi:hypothetical protein
MTAPDAAGEVGEQRKATASTASRPISTPTSPGRRPAEQVEAPCVDVQQQGLAHSSAAMAGHRTAQQAR